MSLEDFNLHEWNTEIFDDMLAYKKEQAAIERVLEKGIKQGIEQGIEQGSKETLIKTIKEMLKNDIDIELISKVTNKSKEEILKIKGSMTEGI